MTDASSQSNPQGSQRWLRILFQFQSYFGLIILFVLAIFFSPVRNDTNLFLSQRNLLLVLMNSAETGILAIGMTMVILVSGIDLSVGSVMALIGVISADLLMWQGWPAATIFAVCIVAGILLGFFNGWTAEQFRVPSFVTTLAMMSAARGLARLWANNNSIPIAYNTTEGGLAKYGAGTGFGDPLFGFIGRTVGGAIPVPAIIMIVCAAVMGIVLTYTTFGRRVYAVGGNPTAAKLSGISVSRIRIYCFIICGVLASVAGMIHASRLNQGSPNESIGYELNAIAAVVIGGASLNGGKGTIGGCIGGALILQILDNILGLNNVSSNIQLIVKGLLVIAAVALQQLRPADNV
jgi:ribose transport system permease protein